MIKPPPSKWLYTLIELEVNGKVVDSRVASAGTYQNMYNILLRYGQLQQLPWVLFISKYIQQRPKNKTYKKLRIQKRSTIKETL